MKKRLMCVNLLIVLFSSMLLNLSYAQDIKRIDEVKIGEKEYMGYPINASYVDNSVCSMQDGNNIIGTVIEGSPAIFMVYDLDNNKLLGMYPIEGTTYAHGHGVAPNGDIYMTTQASAKLARYSPTSKKFEILGELFGEHASYQVSFDEEGNAYVGTYPSAKIVKYDIKKNEFYDYGTVLEGEKYVRAHVYYNGYIYASGYDDKTKFIKLNVKTGEITNLKTPVFDGVLPFEGIKLFYFMDIVTDSDVGDYIITHVYPKTGTSLACIYDLKKEEWISYFNGIYGYQFPRQLNDGKTYAVKNFGLNEKGEFTGVRDIAIAEYDFKTNKVTNTGIKYLEGELYDGLRGASLVTLKDQNKYPGKSIVTVSYDFGVPVIINLKTKKVDILKYVKDEIISSPIEIRSIGKGVNGTIGYGGYKAREAGVFDPSTNEFLKFPMEQVEGIGYCDGKIYYGKYAGAYLYEYDPNLPTQEGVNPKQVAKLGDDQDRIFDIIEADGKVVMCSTPINTSLGGALSIYDPKTGKCDVYRNLIPNQSIASAQYKDGIIYASSHIWGGLATTPVETDAQVIAFDINKREVVRRTTPKLENFGSTHMLIGDLCFDDNGLLWAITSGSTFAMDPKTLEIVKQCKVDPSYFLVDKQKFQPYMLEKLDNGLLVGKYGSGITLFDPITMEYKKIFDTHYQGTTSNGDIIATDYKNFYRVPIYYKDQQISDNEFNERFKNIITLKLNGNKGFVNGNETAIDKNDSNVMAKTIEGRTVVPFRFVAEAVGGEVKWDESTMTASVVVGDKNVSTVIGKKSIFINGVEKEIDVPSVTENGRTLLPLRAFVEALGKQVFWDARGIIIISDEQVDASNDKEYVDRVLHKLQPSLLVDELGNGKADPRVLELSKSVIVNNPKYVTKEDTAEWIEFEFNSDFSQGEIVKKEVTEDGVKGFDCTIPGFTAGISNMKSFRYITSGTVKEGDYTKYPQTIEIVNDKNSKALHIDSPVAGNSVTMYLPTIKFNETYKRDYAYKMTFKAKASAEPVISGTQRFSALLRLVSDKYAKIDQSGLVNVKPSDDYVEYTITIPAKTIKDNADMITGLFYFGSAESCTDVYIKDIRMYYAK